MEFAAYARWRRAWVARSAGIPAMVLEAARADLDCDEKAAWVPEDPRATLAGDAEWASLVSLSSPAA